MKAPRETCAHELGHALMALACPAGVVKRLWVDGSRGSTVTRQARGPIQAYYNCIVCFAGPACEVLLYGRPSSSVEHWAGDYRDAAKASEAHAPNDTWGQQKCRVDARATAFCVLAELLEVIDVEPLIAKLADTGKLTMADIAAAGVVEAISQVRARHVNQEAIA